jgi:hypothetical protein
MIDDSERDARVALTKLLADLDLLFSISFFDRDKNERTWSLTFDVGDDRSTTVQLAFFGGYLSIFSALETDADLDSDSLSRLLHLNGSGPTGAFSVTGRSIFASTSILVSHMDLELLKDGIGGVLRLAREARTLLAEKHVTFRERVRN